MKNTFEITDRKELIEQINLNFYKDKDKLLKNSIDYLYLLESEDKIERLVQIINILFVLYPRNKQLIYIAIRYLSSFYNSELKEELINNYTSALEYIKYITSKVNIKSMIDFGAGVGSWLKAANNYNIKDLTGVEKYYEGNLNFPVEILKQDICLPVKKKYDLAISIEVAEHLKPDMSEEFIDNITSCSDMVLFGAASEFQSGDAHMNCRNSLFWVELFENRNYECIDCFRAMFWNNPKMTKDYVQNTFLYIKKDSQYSGIFKNKTLFDIEHPSLINAHYLNKYKKYKILFKSI